MNENNFEQLMKEIKQIVNKLENENIEIDSAIKLFENGIKNINLADQKLKDIKNRVVKIVEDNKQIELSNIKK